MSKQRKYKQIPKKCPYCNGLVIYTNNKFVFGKPQGKVPYMYVCTCCYARVGTHPNGKPLGLLATAEMRQLKQDCHKYFDRSWKSGYITRDEAYKRLAKKLRIPIHKCHFGYFKVPRLREALKIVKKSDWWM